MVFVHVSRCLIFKVHWPCSLFVISVVSSVSLNRGDYYILAHLKKTSKKVKKSVDKAEEMGYTTKAVAENGSESTLKTI